MKAVIYARYSSENQREESIEGQIRECAAFAERNGITVLQHYIDRAYSATNDNRPEFQRMIKDGGKSLFDIILVWKLDRFARNRYDSARYKAQLKKTHVKVVSATEHISEGSEGILLESVLEGMAEYYSADLSEKVTRGMTENALKCMWNGGVHPLGYIVDKDKHLQIDPTTAPYVLECFKQYAEGATMSEVMEYLNKHKVTNAKGTPFTYNSIRKLLTNRRYIGEYRYDTHIVPDGIPTIVPADLFDRVQEKISKNKKAPARAKAKEDYLLTTKLFCGNCGVYMCGESGTGRNGTVHRYYKCATAKKKSGDCKKQAVPKQWIEDIVVNATMEMVMDDAAIEAIVSMLMALQEQESSDLPFYEKELKRTETGIENLLDAIQNGLYTESTKGRLEKLEAAKADLQMLIAKEKLEKPIIPADFLTFYFHRFRKLDVREEAHRKILIDTFVNAVYVYDDKLLLTFNYKDGTKTITLQDVKKATESNSGSSLDCSAVPLKSRYPFGCLLFALCRKKGLEPINATRMSVARDGLTERNHSVTSPFRRTTEKQIPFRVSAFLLLI